MFAVVEEMGSRVQVGVAAMPRDPSRVIDSSAFLKALRGGSPAADRAFRDLHLHLRAPLIRFISRWLRETEAAEDLLQETLLAVHEGLPTFAGDSGLTAWVYSLAYDKVMDRLSEKYGSGNGSEDDCVPVREVQEVEDVDPRPDETAHQSLLIALIVCAADTIPEHYRVVWRLCDMERMSGEEAAEALGIAPALVRVRLHRARGLIADRLRKARPGVFRKSVGLGHRLRALQARPLAA